MSIDEKAKDIEEKYKKFMELNVDVDVRVMLIAKNARKDFVYVAGLTEEQKQLALLGGETMINLVSPELFEAYLHIKENGSLRGVGGFRDEEVLRKYDSLNEEAKISLLTRFHTDLAALVVNCFEDVEDPVLIETHELLQNWRLDIDDITDESTINEFVTWFHGLEDKEETASDMADILERTDYAVDIFNNAMRSGNPAYIDIAWVILDEFYFENDNLGRGGVEEIDDIAGDKEVSEHFLRHKKELGTWISLYRAIGKGFIGLDFNMLTEVQGIVAQNDAERLSDFYKGVRENAEGGTGQKYVDYVFAELKKGVIGGGRNYNYRIVSERFGV